MSACSGKCCSVFNYPTPPEVLATRGYEDDAFLADMLVTLTPEQAQERALRFDVTPPEGYALQLWAEEFPSYTCRHWNEETRLCGVYEDRPKMCRDYPYGQRCQHDCNCGETGCGKGYKQPEAESEELESQCEAS